jgi:prefoldin subunit 5
MSDISSSLSRDVQLLKESMDILHETVHSQQESLDTIEDAIHATQQDAGRSREILVEASSYSSGYYTVVGTIGAIALGILFMI